MAEKILHISKYYYPFVGGIEQTARDCVNSLEGYEHKVICFNHESDKDLFDIVDGVEIIRCGSFATIASQSLSSSYGKILRKTLKEFNPNIVIFHYPNPFVASMLLRMLPKATKFIVYWHLDIVKQKFLGKFFIVQNKRITKRADKIIATSPNYIEGSRYLSAVKEKCVVVPSPINEDRLQITEDSKKIVEKIKQENKDKIICLAVGRHTEYKGFAYLIEASKYLDDRFEIFITGKGELTEDLKQQATGDKKIHFLGLVSDDELKAYLQAMDIFCFSSITKNEAFGLALAEAMYFGKPVVTFNILGSGVNYVSLNGVTGIEVENRNSKAFAEAMKTLADDKELRIKMGKSGKQRVQKMMLLSQFKENIREVIEEVEHDNY